MAKGPATAPDLVSHSGANGGFAPTDPGLDSMGETRVDAFLGGEVMIEQPLDGYRAGLDAVLLAASVPASLPLGHSRVVLDVGSGVGTVSLCLAHRLPQAEFTLLELQPDMAALATRNVERNGHLDRMRIVCGDVTGKAAELMRLGLADNAYSDVVMNPPYHAMEAGTLAASPGRAMAHALQQRDDQRGGEAGLALWVRCATRVLRPGGLLTMVHKAEALPDILAAMAGRFGGICVKPMLPRADRAAHRVLVKGTKGSRSPFQLCAPLILHGVDDQGQTAGVRADVEAVLRRGAGLPVW